MLAELARLPLDVERLLQQESRIVAVPARFSRDCDFFFLGRGVYYPTAMGGVLKLKEIADVSAKAFSAGEMKHGPQALVDSPSTTVAAGRTHAKMLSTIEEVKARDGKVIALCPRATARSRRSWTRRLRSRPKAST